MPDVPSYRFDDWQLHPRERVLQIKGQRVALGARAFDVLVALVERQGQLVTKNELLDAAWPGLVVEENNISVQIAALRKLLGSHVIATVAGLGYRLAASPATAVAKLPAADAPDAGPAASAPATALFGRDSDVAAVAALLDKHPLVSIIGTGGVGKTSLARAVTARLASGLDVHWIDAVPVRDEAQLTSVVAKAFAVDLGGSSTKDEDLMSALSGVRALLVADNCEHLAQEVALLVGRAREHAPGISWLVTSQVPLHATGELVYRLDPLGVPSAGTSLADALQHGSIALLSSRSGAADRRFRISEQNLQAAIDLCRQLDGLPLAIEMAAARVAVLGLDGVRAQLMHRLRLLAGPRDAPARHHTLRDTFDWSHGLLRHEERLVFRRLQPFVGGFTAAMATRLACAVGAGSDSVDDMQALEALGALVDKSMVQRFADDSGRFFLFESARDYAAQQLQGCGEVDDVRRQHARVVADVFANAASDYARLADDDWAALYVPERHNVRAALDWACAKREPDVLAGLVAALARIDTFTQWQHEIVQLDVPLDVVAEAQPELRSAAYLELGRAHYSAGSREEGSRLTALALQDYRALADLVGMYSALSQLVRLYDSRPGMQAEAAQAREQLAQLDDRDVPLRTRLSCTFTNSLFDRSRTVPLLQELESVAQRAGFKGLVALCRVHITDQLLVESRFEEAVTTAQRFLDEGESRPRVKGLLLHNQALAQVQQGRLREARVGAVAALRMLPTYAHVIVGTLALAYALEGRLTDAAVLTGYAAQVRLKRDQSPDQAEAAAIEQTKALLADGLSPQTLQDLLRGGAGMSTAAIMELVLAG
ncbi:MAG: ATP-binding protein [Rhizobacter sp.]